MRALKVTGDATKQEDYESCQCFSWMRDEQANEQGCQRTRLQLLDDFDDDF